MPSPFAAAAAAAFSTLKASAGENILYRSGLSTIPALTAVPGETTSDLEDRDGLTVKVKTRDYMIAAADLDFGAGPVEPQPGDEIEEALAGKTSTFEVYAPGGAGAQHFRWWDKGHTVYRIHTREIGVA